MSPSRNYRRIAIYLSIFSFLFATVARAAVAGSISGTVTDQTGSVVPNANITVQDVSTGLVYRTLSDSKGYYTLPVLPVGRYELDVQVPGFRGYQLQDICSTRMPRLR